MLELAKKANIPVVIADIGTNSGDYVSFIISDNYDGANGVGEALAAALKKKGWEDGSRRPRHHLAGPQERPGPHQGLPRRPRRGRRQTKEAGLQQMQSYTADETFKFTQDMLTANPDMRGLFIQTDQPAIGALRAIKAARKDGEMLVAAFDGIPEFVDLLQVGRDRRLRHAAALPDGRDAPGEAMVDASRRREGREGDPRCRSSS